MEVNSIILGNGFGVPAVEVYPNDSKFDLTLWSVDRWCANG